jgi:hypothetical protein
MNTCKILYSAICNTRNWYTSVVGDNMVDDVSTNENTELNKNHWTFKSILELLSDLFLPTLPIHAPSWIPNFIKKIIFGGNSKYIPDTEYENTDASESFIYVNGIMSNEDVIKTNQIELRKMFDRPIDLIHNNTDSLVMDLLECLVGKETDDLTEPAMITLYTMSRKLLNPKITKLVIICHSQGTIIVAQALNYLEKLGLDKEKYLEKLEIYAFANCATNMAYIKDNLPYMEHFANDNDLVAALGCNCADDVSEYINISGEIHVVKDKSGHMFNAHYIDNFENDYPESRLNKYIKH